MMWAVLPIKDLSEAKQRLAPVLAPHERRRLFAAMVEDVLAALARTPALDDILVVTRDPAAARLASHYGARVLPEAENRGQTSAVAAAAAELAAAHVDAMLAVPGDVPLITRGEIEAVLAAHGAAPAMTPAMTIVPAWDRRGSNCLLCSPPGLIPFAFGNDSFQPHLAAARAAGVEPRIVPLPGIGLDIDNPADLRMLLARPAETRCHAFLAESGIAARLAAEPDIAKG